MVKTIQKLISDTAHRSWTQRLLSQYGRKSPLQLANKINSFFSELIKDFQPLASLEVQESLAPQNLLTSPYKI